jgi:ribosomal-protein-alanine N-acetyltransferase
MTLKPILIDEDPTQPIYANPFCQDIFKEYPAYYFKTGYHLPWIGYFVMREFQVVGAGGFVGEPKNNMVEIAYGTSKEFEGQGIASFACQQLIKIAQAADSNVIITAITAPEQNASTKILAKNGFECTKVVQDDDIGDAWKWVFKT